MKKYYIVVLAIFMVFSLQAKEKNITKTFLSNNVEILKLESKLGDVKIENWAKDEIEINVAIKALSNKQLVAEKIVEKVEDTKEEVYNDEAVEEEMVEEDYDAVVGAEEVFYVISVSATKTEEDAKKSVAKLKKNYEKSDYLWIPDYKSLSGKELFSVFIGPYEDAVDAFDMLKKYKKENKNAYIVEVSQKQERLSILDKFDYRINNVRQKLIISYAEKEALDEYYNNGGEDWSWFNSDVKAYFDEKFSNSNISYIYGVPFWLKEQDMIDFAKEIGNEKLTFGYYLIDGSKTKFIEHDIVSSVTDKIVNFFGL